MGLGLCCSSSAALSILRVLLVLPTVIARTCCFSIESLLGLLWFRSILTVSGRNSSKFWAGRLTSFQVSSSDAGFSLFLCSFSLF